MSFTTSRQSSITLKIHVENEMFTDESLRDPLVGGKKERYEFPPEFLLPVFNLIIR